MRGSDEDHPQKSQNATDETTRTLLLNESKTTYMIDNFENEYSESQGLITDAGWAEIETTTNTERMLRQQGV